VHVAPNAMPSLLLMMVQEHQHPTPATPTRHQMLLLLSA